MLVNMMVKGIDGGLVGPVASFESFDAAGAFLSNVAEKYPEVRDLYVATIELPVLSPVRVRRDCDGDASILWGVFPVAMTDGEIIDFWDANVGCSDGWRCHDGDWDCCGRMFGGSLGLWRTSTRVLATQNVGRDV